MSAKIAEAHPASRSNYRVEVTLDEWRLMCANNHISFFIENNETIFMSKQHSLMSYLVAVEVSTSGSLSFLMYMLLQFIRANLGI